MSKPELIQWCARNTLNCFLYDRSQTGLSATTDQAIVSGRPLAVSANETFRHLHEYLTPYPLRSLKESIAISGSEVAAMREAWAPRAFARKFEDLLEERRIVPQETPRQSFTLRPIPEKTPGIPKFWKKILKKWHRKKKWPSNQPVLPPYTNPLLSSSSLSGEDLWLDYFFAEKKTGFYVDIGAVHPRFNNHTNRFYSRGWNGINLTPTAWSQQLFQKERPRDLNLQLMIGPEARNATIYILTNEVTASALDPVQAAKRARRDRMVISERTTDLLPVSEILRQHHNGPPIDFLAASAEGRDFEALSTNDWSQVRPTFVIVELKQQRDQVKQLMNKEDYVLLLNNTVNGVFVDATSRLPEVCKLLKLAPV